MELIRDFKSGDAQLSRKLELQKNPNLDIICYNFGIKNILIINSFIGD